MHKSFHPNLFLKLDIDSLQVSCSQSPSMVSLAASLQESLVKQCRHHLEEPFADAQIMRAILEDCLKHAGYRDFKVPSNWSDVLFRHYFYGIKVKLNDVIQAALFIIEEQAEITQSDINGQHWKAEVAHSNIIWSTLLVRFISF